MKFNKITFHCSATPCDEKFGIDWIRDLHVNKNNWSDIGYHYVIHPDGSVQYGRPLTRIGAHVSGHNYHNIGICLVGGVNENNEPEMNFTMNQQASLLNLALSLQKVFNIPDSEIYGHRDFSKDLNNNGVIEANERIKECPCFDAKRFMKSGVMYNEY